jgi:hypothetical protein
MSGSNVDPDIQAAFNDTQPTASSHANIDSDILEAFSSPKSIRDKDSSNPIAGLYNPIGEAALHAITGGIGALGGGLNYLGTLAATGGDIAAAKAVQEATQDKLTYQPRTSAGKSAASAIDTGASYLGAKEGSAAGDYIMDKTGSPLLASAANTALNIPQFLLPKAAGKLADALPKDLTAQQVADAATARQSGGAAATAPNISAASPSIQQAIADTKPQNVNQTALQNHLEADQHGVQLTKGQATRDPAQYSEEQNTTHPDVVARINAQNNQMVNAIDTIRRDASPTNVANSPRENGQVVLNDLKAYDEPKVKAISAAYDDANSSNVAAGKGALKLDPQPGIDHATQALEDREELLPSEGKSILEKMKTAADTGEGIPLKQAETWKTVISRATRKYQQSGDTNAVSALSDFRDSLEQMQPSNAAAGVQAKFNNARALAKARFDEIDADPAYAAAVGDTVKKGQPSPLADTFIDDYALSKSAPKSQIDLMMGKLSDEGKGAVASHTLSAVRKGAVNASGNVVPNGYNTALTKYGDKLDSLVSPETQDSLESLGRVITNAKVAPPGNYVNYSKSGVIGNAARGIGEGIVQSHTYGLGIPILKGLSKNKFANDALAPGAGIDQTK